MKLFEIDRHRYTCAGGTAPLDLMLFLVRRDYNREVASAILRTVHYRPHQGTRRTPVYIGSQPGAGARLIT